MTSAQVQAVPETLELVGDEQRIDLQPWLEYRQTDRQLTFEALQSDRAIWTSGSNRSDMNFGYTQDAVWIKLNLRSIADRDTLWHLHFPYSSLNQVEIYHTPGEVRRSGASVPVSQRDLPHRDPVFLLRLSPGEQKTLYLRAHSSGSLTLTSQLWSSSAFATFSVNSMALIALYCGMLLALAAYNLLLFSVLRERTYLLYVGFVLSFGLGALAFTGLGARYLWPEMGEWGSRIMPFALCLSGAIAPLFTRDFLDTRRHMPGWYRILTALA
ncbi:MAG: 7TM-DISM domain-containing protein, partial [Pseudomonas sp.]